jgi:hypothetical protein
MMTTDASRSCDLLDLASLRAGLIPGAAVMERSLAKLAFAGEDLRMTRRELLGLTGLAAAGMSPLTRALEGRLMGPLEFSATRGRVVFSVGGRARWVVDVRQFDGRPRLSFEREGDHLHIKLEGALLPGTDIPADFEADITRGLGNWRLDLDLKLGAGRLTAPFARWLTGSTSATGSLRAAGGWSIGDGCRFALQGRSEAEFGPDWRLRLTGRQVAGLRDVRVGDLVGAETTLRLAGEADASLLARAAERRTLIEVRRGDERWALHKALTSGPSALLEADEEPFDAVQLEAATGGRHVLAARAHDGTVRLSPAGWRALSGDALRLPLTEVRFASAAEGGGRQEALMAALAEPSWARCGEVAVQVGRSPKQACVELVRQDGRAEVARCTATLLSLVAPMAGALIAPAVAHAETTVDLIGDGTQLAQRGPIILRPTGPAAPKEDEKPKPVEGPVLQPRIPGRVLQPTPTPTPAPPPGATQPGPVTQPGALTPIKPGPQVMPDVGALLRRPGGLIGLLDLGSFTVPVTRAEDLLSLQFRFINLGLQAAADKSITLARLKAGDPAFLIVEFPPQHVGEEAILETAAEFKDVPGNPPSSGPLPGVNNPVRARLSGGSRLVFRLPNTMQSIPYTLEALLDWTQLVLCVAPNALPPPTPPMTPRPGAMETLGGGAAVRQPVPAQPVGGQPTLRTPVLRQPGLGPATPRVPTQPAPVTPAPQVPPSLQRTVPLATAVTAKADPARMAELKLPTDRLELARPGTDLVRPLFPGDLLVADTTPRPEPLNPDRHTAIEAPYRLILSPHAGETFIHSPRPVTLNGRTELWHTRLGVRMSNGQVQDRAYLYKIEDGVLRLVKASPVPDPSGYWRTVRAIWSPDWSVPSPTSSDLPFRMSLDRRDRSDLVTLTSDFETIKDCQQRTVAANRLMLSSLGAWLDVHYAVPKPVGVDISLEEWVHQATMGRDQYVKVVRKGYLFPFGQAAVLIKVTERKFEETPEGSVAYLRQRYFIVVRHPEKSYPAYGQAAEARDFPPRKVTVKTLITPSLDDPKTCQAGGGSISADPLNAFWPKVGGKEFEFHMVADDWAGNHVAFSAPIIFIDAGIAYRYASMSAACTYYNQSVATNLKERDLGGQSLALADPSPGKDDTSFEASSMRFGARAPEWVGAVLATAPAPARTSYEQAFAVAFELQDQPQFYPKLAQAQVRVPAVTQLMGQDLPVRVAISDTYVNDAWDTVKNAGQVFLKLVDEAGADAIQGLLFPTDKSGGVMSPDLNISGLSRGLGPVAGSLANLASGAFDAKNFFDGMFPKLFGCIDLVEILLGAADLGQVPGLTVDTQKTDGIPSRVIIDYVWQPKVSSALVFEDRGGQAKFTFRAHQEVPLLPGPSAKPPVTWSEAKLETFRLNLFDLLMVDFGLARFYAELGKSPDVDVDLQKVEFGGALQFINELKELLQSSGLGGLSIDILPTGLTVGYSINIPTVGVGVMSIQNMSLGAQLSLSFINDPLKLRFNFCERARPFLLTVSMFGGGGFFAIELQPDGIQMMEASFEFGGNFAFDIGVASGGAWLMAGFYLKYEGSLSLTGYVRCGGRLSVLGLITISAEFYLGLTYEEAGNRLYGVAKLEVEIEILFFSISVSLEVERQFAGSSSSTAMNWDGARLAAAGDDLRRVLRPATGTKMKSMIRPAMSELISASQWQDYCEAFA